MKTRITGVIDAPIEKVFALIADIDRAREWMPADAKVERVTPGPLRVGSRYRETRPVMGKPDTEEYEVTAFDPPNLIEVYADGTKGTAGRGGFRIQIFLDRAGPGATKVKMKGFVSRMGCLGIIAYPVIRGIMRQHLIADFAAVKAWIERQP
jgi:uncharacterized protein YndB with AHSA1/START domain